MTYLKNISVLLSVLLVLVTSCLATPVCGPNEVIDDCPSNCTYDYCPKNELHDRTPCPKPKECPPPACKCGFNYRRADNGTCIPTTKCPPFECSRVNEEFKACPRYCPSDDCRDASLFGECPYFLLIVVNCTPSCRCIKHHWRKDGVCVPYEECPNLQEDMITKEKALLAGLIKELGNSSHTQLNDFF